MSMQSGEKRQNLINKQIICKDNVSSISIINSVALQNPDINGVVKRIQELKSQHNIKMIASISADTIAEYVENARILSKEEIVGIEVNLSCPNIKSDSDNPHVRNFATDPKAIEEVFAAIKKVTKIPLYAKISPNIDDITKIAIAAEKGGADVIVATNSYVGYRINPDTGAPIISKGTGGYSSPALFPLTLRSVFLISKVVKIPIVAVGGVSTTQDVIDALSVGATAVQIGTVIGFDPNIFNKIKTELPIKLKKMGINDINDLIGRAHKFKVEDIFPVTHSFKPKK
jgi:dihydroorotate dehydrogenase (NAD+) catalytic subunit